MHAAVRHFVGWLLTLGVFGPVLLGIADSSFLFLPFGNDLLVVILTVRNHAGLPLYVIAAAIGSMLGVLLLDVVCRKGGEEGLKRLMSPKRLEYVRQKMKSRAGAAVAVASLAPPPFPFTLVIASASAFAYPRQKLLGLVLFTRAVRFTILGLLAIHFGRGILRMANTPAAAWMMAAFIGLCLIGSVLQLGQWLQNSPQRSGVLGLRLN